MGIRAEHTIFSQESDFYDKCPIFHLFALCTCKHII